MTDTSLPKGWKMCAFGDVAAIRNGYAFKSKDFKKRKETKTDIPLIRQSQLVEDYIDLSTAVYLSGDFAKKYKNYLIEKGDILIGMSGSIGKVCYYNHTGSALQNQRTGKIEVTKSELLDNKYVGLYLSCIERELINKAKGVAVQNISGKDILSLPFPLPPLVIQKSIIARIEELFSELDSGIASLKTAQEQLKIYRQSLLKHAFEGKLTEQWRKDNADQLETPEQLLARIQTERETRYQQQLDEWKQAVKDWEAKGKEGKKPSKPKRLSLLKEVAGNGLVELSNLPVAWNYVRLGLLIDEPTYGTSAKCSYESEGVGVLRIPNITNGVIDDNDLKFARFDIGEVDHLALKKGDLLTIRSNGSISLVGTCAIIKEKDVKHIFAGYLIRLRPNQKLILPSFLLAAMSSHLLRQQIERAAKSTSGVNNINSGELQNLIIPIASIEEQKEIVNQLEEKLSIIEQNEKEIESALAKAELLRQSILKKAFSGKLS